MPSKIANRQDLQNLNASGLAMSLQNCHGPLVGGQALAKLLAYTNLAAFRQAVARGNLPVKVFTIPHRRGKFAYTSEVAAWIDGLNKERMEKNMS